MFRTFQLLILIAALIVLPGGCLSEPLPPNDYTAPLLVQRLAQPSPDGSVLGDQLAWADGWELSSDNYHFGGFSALVARDDGRLTAFSDRSQIMAFDPETIRQEPARFDWLREILKADRSIVDLEAVFEDPDTGTFWAAFERKNVILRFDAEEKLTGWSAPAAMQSWTRNSGAEAMTRLPGGQFLIVPEGTDGWFSDTHEALIFAGDPVEDAEWQKFKVPIPGGFRPVDAAVLPDGSLALLLRKFTLGFPPSFESAILLGTLSQEKDGWTWTGESLVSLSGAIPPENYEGMAVAARTDGGADIWLISDDNMSVFQRTYLIKLAWSGPQPEASQKAPKQKAPKQKAHE